MARDAGLRSHRRGPRDPGRAAQFRGAHPSRHSHVQIGYNAKSRVVGIRSAAAEVHGSLKLRAQPNGRSRLVDAKRFFAHRGLVVHKARGLEVENLGGGIGGFRLPEEGAGEAEAPAKATKTGGRRKAAAG